MAGARTLSNTDRWIKGYRVRYREHPMRLAEPFDVESPSDRTPGHPDAGV